MRQAAKVQRLKDAPPAGFTGPATLPTDESQHQDWP
jgi:hypothetical protein